jgi:hypothetical protein
LLLLSTPGDLTSCGISWETVFTFRGEPDDPASFAQGRLGVLQPTYQRSYLLAAYRLLSGTGLSHAERDALFNPAPNPLLQASYTAPWLYTQQWLAARATVPGLGPAPRIQTYRSNPPTDYYEYRNCPADAFHNAAVTLNARANHWGRDSERLRSWVTAQDQVFADCGSAHSIPDATSDPELRADRQYQIAAAHFYIGDFQKAEQEFRAIAADASSPWHIIAPYLAARALIRRATVGGDTSAMPQAEKQLEAVLANPALHDLHAAAEGLLGFVRAQLCPDKTLAELAAPLTRHGAESAIAKNLSEYFYLLGRVSERRQIASDDLSRWLLAIRQQDRSLAVRSWQETRSLPWLVAAIGLARGGDAGASALMLAAERVPPSSPGFLHVAFHAARLRMESGQAAEARRKLDALLARRDLSRSTRNLMRAARMKLARDWDEWMTYAPRHAVGQEYWGGTIVLKRFSARGPDDALDGDATQVINLQMQLALIVQASAQASLPAAVRRDLAGTAWIRAVVLGDEARAAEVAPQLARLDRDAAPLVAMWQAAGSEDERRFVEACAILQLPGVKPFLARREDRDPSFRKLDPLRDNWWSDSNIPAPPTPYASQDSPLNSIYHETHPDAAFLTTAQREEAKRELASLSATGPVPVLLGERVMRWVKQHPQDARAAEALYLVVRATRHACDAPIWPAGPQTTPAQAAIHAMSHRAFQFLHQRYPHSEWAAKTPYWF